MPSCPLVDWADPDPTRPFNRLPPRVSRCTPAWDQRNWTEPDADVGGGDADADAQLRKLMGMAAEPAPSLSRDERRLSDFNRHHFDWRKQSVKVVSAMAAQPSEPCEPAAAADDLTAEGGTAATPTVTPGPGAGAGPQEKEGCWRAAVTDAGKVCRWHTTSKVGPSVRAVSCPPHSPSCQPCGGAPVEGGREGGGSSSTTRLEGGRESC